MRGSSTVKVFVIRKRSLIAACIIIGIVLAVLIGTINFAPAAVQAMAGKRLIPIYGVDRQDKVCSLTFDAAWGNEDTQTLINILNKYHVNATFFVVGAWVDKYPESVKALHDAGNEVMNHSNSHPHMPKLSQSDMIREIQACDDKIEKVTGARPTLFRPPFGHYNNGLIEALTSTNHYCIQWTVDSLDWKGISASQIQQRVIPKVKNGSIILFHNAALHTPEALPGIIESLLKQGFKIVPVSKLIYKDI